MTTAVPPITEREFQAQVVQLGVQAVQRAVWFGPLCISVTKVGSAASISLYLWRHQVALTLVSLR